MKNRPLTFAKSWSTHMAMLIKVVQLTDGPIFEMGAGLYSTPLLHWLCAENHRKLVTLETDPIYLDLAKKYRSRNHRIINDINKLSKNHWSVVLIDGDTDDRANIAIKFKDCADYILLHDSNEPDKVYGYDKVYPLFKYRYDWKFATPWVTVLSNFKDLSKL